MHRTALFSLTLTGLVLAAMFQDGLITTAPRSTVTPPAQAKTSNLKIAPLPDVPAITVRRTGANPAGASILGVNLSLPKTDLGTGPAPGSSAPAASGDNNAAGDARGCARNPDLAICDNGRASTVLLPDAPNASQAGLR